MPNTPRVASRAPDDHLDLGRLSDFVGFRLRRIQNQLSSAFSAESLKHGLRPGEFSALAIISANRGLSQAELAREIGLDKSAAVSVVDDLERLGFAERRRFPNDRRRHALFATREGEQALEEMFARLASVERVVLNALGSQDVQVLSSLLDRIYDSCFRH